MVSDHAGGVIANEANVSFVKYGVLAIFSSIGLESISGKTIEYIDRYHPNPLRYRLLDGTENGYESDFVRPRTETDNQLESDHQAAQRSHKYMMVKMKDLYGFINDIEEIIYCIGFKLILKRNNNDRALFRVNAGAGAIANDSKTEISLTTCCVLCIDPSNDRKLNFTERIY